MKKNILDDTLLIHHHHHHHHLQGCFFKKKVLLLKGVKSPSACVYYMFQTKTLLIPQFFFLLILRVRQRTYSTSLFYSEILSQFLCRVEAMERTNKRVRKRRHFNQIKTSSDRIWVPRL